MLKLINIKKTYIPKKGQVVKALDDINLEIEDKGMVFILGKSGSGKSTLLNILGGLDTYDQGEMFIYDKSTKDFTQNEFDSYRNTYMGFIFQEYNLLEELSVGANISLALDLQSKGDKEEKIARALEQVDMSGYQDRKINELSGGQLQRVAIARSIVKDPDIIFADEPTGALDSSTGNQIFELLKKLSEDKLVLIVSHDREFAEKYGDRIIELADGKIIDDVTKDIDNNDFIITEKSKENTINENQKSFKLIKSKLPLKNALFQSLTSLKAKPIKLIFTILLSAFAFLSFGIMDTMIAFDSVYTGAQSFYDNDVEYAIWGRDFHYETAHSGYGSSGYGFSEDDIEEIEARFPNAGLFPVYSYNIDVVPDDNRKNDESNDILSADNFVNQDSLSNYYYANLKNSFKLAKVEDINLDKLGFTLIGDMPASSEEIIISKLYAEFFIEAGWKNPEDDNDTREIASAEELIGKKIILWDHTFTVSGLLDTNYDNTEYSKLKAFPEMHYFFDDDIEFHALEEEYTQTIHGPQAIVLGNSDLFETNIILEPEGRYDVRAYYMESYLTSTSGANQINNLAVIESIDGEIKYLNGKSELDINDKSMFISGSLLIALYREKTEEIVDVNIAETIEDWATYHREELQDYMDAELAEGGVGYSDVQIAELYSSYLINNPDNTYIEDKNIEYFHNLAVLDLIDDILANETFGEYEISFSTKYNKKTLGNLDELNLIGIVWEENSIYFNDYDIWGSNKLYLAAETINSLGIDFVSESSVNYMMCKMPNTKAGIREFVEFSFERDPVNYTSSTIQHPYIETLIRAEDMINDMSKTFLVIGLILLGFAILLLSNFISNSISYKKQEIGILRALGARKADVLKIFIGEALIIAFINAIIASIMLISAAKLLNNEFQIFVNGITIIVVRIRQILIILGIGALASIIASSRPSYNVARKKPIDAIRKR